MTQKLLKLALEFVESVHDGEWGSSTNRNELVAAIKEALAQTQEPVAVVDVHEFYDNCANFSLLQKLPKGKHTLYTTPPQRTWVGLTDEVITKVIDSMPNKMRGFMDGWDLYDFTRAIEAKLKEKNT